LGLCGQVGYGFAGRLGVECAGVPSCSRACAGGAVGGHCGLIGPCRVGGCVGVALGGACVMFCGRSGSGGGWRCGFAGWVFVRAGAASRAGRFPLRSSGGLCGPVVSVGGHWGGGRGFWLGPWVAPRYLGFWGCDSQPCEPCRSCSRGVRALGRPGVAFGGVAALGMSGSLCPVAWLNVRGLLGFGLFVYGLVLVVGLYLIGVVLAPGRGGGRLLSVEWARLGGV